jgi:rare lipoprotein A
MSYDLAPRFHRPFARLADINPSTAALAALTFAFVLVTPGCTTQVPYNPGPPPPQPSVYTPPPPKPVASTPVGHSERASYYGGEFAGHLTKSGEVYDPDSLTAASKHLPIGSYAKVTNPTTGRSVVVRINDRGPHVRGRNIDLSERAAKEIGITHKGVARVKVAHLSPGAAKAEQEASASQHEASAATASSAAAVPAATSSTSASSATSSTAAATGASSTTATAVDP